MVISETYYVALQSEFFDDDEPASYCTTFQRSTISSCQRQVRDIEIEMISFALRNDQAESALINDRLLRKPEKKTKAGSRDLMFDLRSLSASKLSLDGSGFLQTSQPILSDLSESRKCRGNPAA
jgi:hypothetical protein